MSNSESKTFAYNLNKWGIGSTGVAVVSGYIASLGVPAAGAVGVGFFWLANEINYYMTSNGTLIYLSNWNPINIVQVSGR